MDSYTTLNVHKNLSYASGYKPAFCPSSSLAVMGSTSFVITPSSASTPSVVDNYGNIFSPSTSAFRRGRLTTWASVCFGPTSWADFISAQTIVRFCVRLF